MDKNGPFALLITTQWESISDSAEMMLDWDTIVYIVARWVAAAFDDIQGSNASHNLVRHYSTVM
jgi:hypothetical protein